MEYRLLPLDCCYHRHSRQDYRVSGLALSRPACRRSGDGGALSQRNGRCGAGALPRSFPGQSYAIHSLSSQLTRMTCLYR